MGTTNSIPTSRRRAGRWPRRFFDHFLLELASAGYSPADIARFVWKPYAIDDLAVTGDRRDLSFERVEATPSQIERRLAKLSGQGSDVDSLLAQQKLVLVLFPGYTHHTLQYPAFYEQVEPRRSVSSVLKLEPPVRGKRPQETFTSRGRRGMKLVYVAYPRSNAATDVILEPTFEMLARSRNLARWIGQGYKLVLVGYSYGAVIALELLEAMNSGRFEDRRLLQASEAMLAINGAIGGSYLADTVADPDAILSAQTAVGLTRTFPPLGAPLGLQTDEERDDLIAGLESLGHPVRQQQIERMNGRMPKHLKYVSVSAFLPANDYDTNPLRNLDDSSMYLQSLASKGVSIYNDGQMVLEDCLIPPFRGVPRGNRIDLGAVRSHHWGVSWRTFSSGVNEFPRVPYYRALIATLGDIGITGG